MEGGERDKEREIDFFSLTTSHSERVSDSLGSGTRLGLSRFIPDACMGWGGTGASQ
jgi:hypothetical protein